MTSTVTSDYIKVDGPSEAVKNLTIELCVEDADRNEIIGRCVWDGESYAPGYEVHRYNKVNRIVKNFNVILRVKYKGRYVVVESVSIHVDEPGEPIIVEVGSAKYRLGGENSSVDLPEISESCNIDGEIIRVTFKLTVKITSLIRALAEKVTEFQYIIDNGIIEIQGRTGKCRIIFTGRVEVPVNPEVVALGLLSLLAGVRPFLSRHS